MVQVHGNECVDTAQGALLCRVSVRVGLNVLRMQEPTV